MREFHADQLILAGAETSSKGNQRKWISRDGAFYVKERFEYQGKFWRDDLVEVIASQYASLCHLETFEIPVLQQFPCLVDGRPAVYSSNFCSNTQVFVSFQRLCNRSGTVLPNYLQLSARENYAILCTALTALTGLNAYTYILAMVALDTVVGNEDRHYHNFGVLYDSTTQAYSYAPLFDFGLGLFEHDRRYEDLRFRDCLPLMQCKPLSLDSEEVVSFLTLHHGDFLRDFLPASVNPADFYFPSENAESYFRNRNLSLGVRL